MGTLGYNIINFSPPLSYHKGTALLIIATQDARVAIDTASSASYRDYAWTVDNLLDPGMNVLANVITQSTASGQTTRTNSVTHAYATPGEKYMYTKFTCDLMYDYVMIVVGQFSQQTIQSP